MTIRSVDLIKVRIPRIEFGIGLFDYANGIGGLVLAPTVDAALFAQHLGPHIDGVGAEDGPFKDVSPTQGVAASGAGQFEQEGGNTNKFSRDESDVDAKFAPRNVHH